MTKYTENKYATREFSFNHFKALQIEKNYRVRAKLDEIIVFITYILR